MGKGLEEFERACGLFIVLRRSMGIVDLVLWNNGKGRQDLRRLVRTSDRLLSEDMSFLNFIVPSEDVYRYRMIAIHNY